MWRVLIVEDDAETSAFFAASVERHAQLSLVGCAVSVAAARTLLEESGQVDVVLTDLGLPDGSGLDVIRLARRLHPACDVMVISMFGDEANVLASIEAGALGYIHKDSRPEDVAATILEMRAGASHISPMIARRVLAKYLSLKDNAPTPPVAKVDPAPDPALSSRELEVCELIARGFSYLEIARLEQISVHTVKSHIKNLYRKLAVSSKNEAVYEATRMGLLRP